MKTRAALISCIAFLWVMDGVHAQETITNLTQLANGFSRQDLFYMPMGSDWEIYLTDPQPWWIDMSQLSWLQKLKESAPTLSNRCLLGEAHYGVQPIRLKVTLELLTGDLVFRLECSSEELARVVPPAEYEPGQWPSSCETVERLWKEWQKIQSDPDWQEWYGPLADPTLTLHVNLGDINDKSSYDAAIVAEEEAWTEAQAASSASGFTAMAEDEDGGGMMLMESGSCVITNEAEMFRIVNIARGTNGWVTLTWQSCSDHIYGVLSVDQLTLSPQWVSRAGMWGGDGATSWTDTTTAGIDHRFYKVRRILPTSTSDWDSDRMPDVWEADHGLNPFDATDAGADPDGDGQANIVEFFNGTDPQQFNQPLDLLVNGGAPYTASLTIPILSLSTNYPKISVSYDPSMTNAVLLTNSRQMNFTLSDKGDGLYHLHFQFADAQGQPHSLVIPKTVILDRVSPVITITSPASNAVLDQAFITLEALAYDPEPSSFGDVRPLSIWINEQRYWDRSGTNVVITRFPVPAGTNAFAVTIRAADGAGHTNQLTCNWTVNPSGDTTAPHLSSFNIATNMLLPDVEELWVEAAVDDSNALISAIVSAGAGDVSTNLLNVRGLKVEGLVPLASGTNIVVLRARDAAGNATSNMFTLIRSARYRAVITSPAVGEFATSPSIIVSGYVSAKFDEGLPTERNVTTVTINGATAVLGSIDANGNLPFTTTNAIPAGDPITGGIGGSGIPTNPPPIIPPAQSPEYEVMRREWHLDYLDGSPGDSAHRPNYRYTDCSLTCADWTPQFSRQITDYEADTSVERYQLSYWSRVGSACVGDPHPELFSWQLAYLYPPTICTHTNSSSGGEGGGCAMDWPSKALWFGIFTSDGSANLAGQCYYGYVNAYQGLQLGRVCYRGALTFRAPRQYGTNTTVLFTFEGVDYERPHDPATFEPIEPLDLSQVKYRGQSPFTYSNETGSVSYLISVDGGREYTISEDNFQWPAAKDSRIVSAASFSGSIRFLASNAAHYMQWTNFHNLSVRITRADPDISVLCAGCTMQFYAETNPRGRPVKWSITSNETGAASISTNGLLAIGAGATKGNVVVRVVDAQEPQAHDERSIFVFVPPANAEHTKVLGQYLSPAEIDLAASHFLDGLGLRKVSSEAKDRTASHFTNAVDRVDGAIGNAFQHAYGSCLAAQRFGIERAKDAGDAHEEYTSNPCNQAGMDLYNNGVGRSLGCQSCDCDQTVMQALNEGKLRWQKTLPPPPCPQYETKPEPTP